ncbi:tubulin epsilon and delta complex protein 2 isoform X2 [Grus americana]|uniref:tubulin epsilon and delta complex protein 2-like isoform X2 n=1 Tax=Grus americana TaxID=9117 RepID=UPI00240832EA|nr:tubulin epsilon and delta complex protein 2-like isoform X2 [Grus americana]XP_054699340.1 tubulin epsilon and delta complex protein 2 isoform X2 [Grus americana]
MLPAGCGWRLAAALSAALGEGAERRRELEQRTARSRALLRRWDSEEDEQPQPEAGSSNGHENKPSPRELEELELLNRALEKALKVRKSILKTPLEAQGATVKKSAGEGPAPKNAQEQQVPAVEDVPESTRVRAVTKNPASLKKPSRYQLRAPYRTEPDVKKTQRRAPARCISQGPRTAGKSSSKGLACKQGRSHRTTIGDRELSAPAEPQKTPGLSRSALNEQKSFSIEDSAGGKNSVAAGKQLFDAGKKSCGFLEESSKKEDPATEGALGRSTSPQTVTLQEKGCQLKLPLPYRKAYSRNSRAWERCRLCQTSADAAAARNRFIERIQTTFCSPMPAFSPAEIEEELKALQDVPSLLSQYVEAEPADHPTLQREYESLLTLEGLQTRVSQYLHKLQLLRAAVESQARLRPDCAGDVGSCSPGCVPARGRTCDSAGMLAVPLLCYSSSQELRDLFALKLQVSMLHQEITLQKVMMAELLPVLESRLYLEASAAQLYRAIYTQLCEGGKRFPVLVRDELVD